MRKTVEFLLVFSVVMLIAGAVVADPTSEIGQGNAGPAIRDVQYANYGEPGPIEPPIELPVFKPVMREMNVAALSPSGENTSLNANVVGGAIPAAGGSTSASNNEVSEAERKMKRMIRRLDDD